MPFTKVAILKPVRAEPALAGFPWLVPLSEEPPALWVRLFGQINWAETTKLDFVQAPKLVTSEQVGPAIAVPGPPEPEDLKRTLDAILFAVRSTNATAAPLIAEHEAQEQKRQKSAREQRKFDGAIDEWWTDQTKDN